jgi:hypothetical protein
VRAQTLAIAIAFRSRLHAPYADSCGVGSDPTGVGVLRAQRDLHSRRAAHARDFRFAIRAGPDILRNENHDDDVVAQHASSVIRHSTFDIFPLR